MVPRFQPVVLGLLYHISMEDKYKSLFTFTDCLNKMYDMLMRVQVRARITTRMLVTAVAAAVTACGVFYDVVVCYINRGPSAEACLTSIVCPGGPAQHTGAHRAGSQPHAEPAQRGGEPGARAIADITVVELLHR